MDEIRSAIQRRLAALSGIRCIVAANDPRYVRIDIDDCSLLYGRRAAALSAEAIVELLLQSIASIPVDFAGSSILIAPSIMMSGGTATTDAGTSDVRSDEAVAALERRSYSSLSSEWCRSYREDMRRAVAALEAIEDDRVQLYWQPVRDASMPGGTFYHECLVRIVGSGGELIGPDTFIPALERLGMMRAFDCYMVQNVLHELSDTPGGMLAVNISAQSAVDDGWWHSIKEMLRAAPDIARRLVIEITETEEIRSISATIEFVAALRRLGCRIALDDFGLGHMSLRQVIALKPDVVKIDAFYVAWAAQAPGGHEAIVHMVKLLATLSPTVIVEGIETLAQSRMILAAGGVWQQGYFHGAPTVVRPRFSDTGIPANEGPTPEAPAALSGCVFAQN
jgi:EAL domain-containing protein (putative c-di-GMP-specific phosphodiesterase class I)